MPKKRSREKFYAFKIHPPSEPKGKIEKLRKQAPPEEPKKKKGINR